MSAEARRRDTEARRAAQQDFVRPLVLEAGAGTGKTAALVARVVAWSLGEGWRRVESEGSSAGEAAEPERVAANVLRRVVAITFTEAAAAEMGQRVSEALGEIERGSVPVGVEFGTGACPPALRTARAAALRAVLDQMRVHTIHAFCRRLLAEHPIEARLHPHFAVDADQSRQKAVVREVVEAALPDLLAGSPAFLHLVRAAQGPRAVEEALLLLLQQGVAPRALEEDPLAPARVGGLLQELAARLEQFAALEAGRLEALRGAPKAAATAGLLRQLRERLAGCDQRAASALTDLRAWLEEARFDVGYLARWAGTGFGKRGADALGDDAARLAERARELHTLLQHLLRLDAQLLTAAREVLAPLYADVCRILRARGIATFPSLLRDARDLLERDAAVCRVVRGQIDQLLVDEFQDTDPVQCDVVRRLALEGPEAERPGLFLVGDPKQSIYGWRSADLAAYEGFLQRVRRAGGAVHSLAVNHRSAPAILDEVARLVEPVMQPEPRLQPAFVRLLPSERHADDPGFAEAGCAPVEHWVSWRFEAGVPTETKAAEGNAIEARALAAELARLHAGGCAWRDFGVLFRAGTDLETYLAELRRAGVPFAVEGDRSYFQRREIIEAAALVRCVLDPHDQLALLTLLRSAVVGVPDAALVPLWARELPARMADLQGATAGDFEGLRSAVAEAACEVPADVPGIARVAGWTDNLLAAARALALLRVSFDEDPADRFVEKLRGLFFFEVTEAARYLGAYRLANLDRFFRDLLAALRDGEGDPRAILRGLREDVSERREAEEGRPKEAVEDAVQVTTIHKAKGLAFEHVYLLQLHKGRGNQKEARAEQLDGRLEYLLLGARTPGYHRLEARREAVERCERVRTLYVATTRARRRLVLAGVHPEGAFRGGSRDSHVALLAERAGGLPDLAGAAGRLAAQASFDAAGARFVFPALRERADETPARQRSGPADVTRARQRSGPADVPRARQRSGLADLSAARATAAGLARRRAAAEAQRERPFAAAVSSLAHEAALDGFREGEPSGDGGEGGSAAHPGPTRDAAAAVGTAVHRALERLDLSQDLAEGLAQQRARLEDEIVRGLAADERPAALARAAELLERFAGGPLLARLREIAPHVLARELPVLLPPDADAEAPAGYLSGTIDLLYRDPHGGALVVADYKTDLVEGDADLAARSSWHARQGAGYVRAVQEALALAAPPRFELWFLHAGRIEVAPL